MASNRLAPGDFQTPLEAKKSLHRIYQHSYDVPVLLILSIITLIFGLCLPIITFKELFFWKTTFSVLTGIQNLITEKHVFLAVVVFLFSILFPIGKLIALLTLWFKKMTSRKRDIITHWLGILGKWSMLDVFVVAMMIVIAKISNLAKARAEIGIYIFGGSILLAMIAAMRLDYLAKKIPEDHSLTQILSTKISS